MTCYEIVTGCFPYDGLRVKDTISQILQGRCPELPHELPEFVRNIIIGCWHSNPLERPTFSAICMALKLKSGPNPMSVVIDNKSQNGASIVKVEKWNNPQALTLLEVMQKLMDMEITDLKAFDSSSTTMIIQYFEVTDCKGRKVVNDQSIANITKALSLPIKTKWREAPRASFFENTIVQMHVIEVVAEWSAGLFEVLSGLLVAMNFQVHSVRCWTREGRLECVIYVEGAKMGTLMWELRHNMEYFPISAGHFEVIVNRVAAEEFSDLNKRLHNLKSMDLTRPRSSSNIRVYQRMKGSHSPEVFVCLENRWPLVHVSRDFADMGYESYLASIDYPLSYVFEKGGVNKSEDIDVGNLRGDRLESMIHRILDIANERGCPAGGQLIVSGYSQLLLDLMESLRKNDLVVTGGQVYRDGWECSTGHFFPPGSLEFFVTEKPVVGAG